METIDLLTSRLEQLSKEFNILLTQNNKLKNDIMKLQDKNDIYSKTTQDFTLAVSNILKKENKS